MSEKIPTISTIVNEKTRRHTLPSNSEHSSLVNIRRIASLDRTRRQILTVSNLKKPSVPDIPEAEQSDEDGAITQNIGKSDNSARVSFTKNNRKVSNMNKQNRINSVEKGYVNDAYDRSNGSSIHGSMASLPVIREQYCLCNKWTKLEKILITVVSVLALIIVVLVIIISVKSDGLPKGSPGKLALTFGF